MPFSLSEDQLMDIAGCMARDIRTGLERDDTDILCLPTFVPLARPPETGTVLAIKTLLTRMGLKTITVSIQTGINTNLAGCAISALMKQEHIKWKAGRNSLNSF